MIKTKLPGRTEMEDFYHFRGEVLAEGIARGMHKAVRHVKKDFREPFKRSGLGKLSLGFKVVAYPRRGIKTMRPVLWVFPNGGSRTIGALSAHGYGARITPKSGKYLAIPTSAAPKKGIGGNPISPTTFPESSIGKLHFIPPAGKRPALLVIKNARTGKRGNVLKKRPSRAGKPIKNSNGRSTVIMFFLIPKAHQPSKVKYQNIISDAVQSIARSIDVEIRKSITRRLR